MTSAQTIEERANMPAYTLTVVRDYIVSSAFKDSGIHALSEKTKRVANALAVTVYLDHCHIEHEAIECVGTRDLPTFFMAMYAGALMANASMRVGINEANTYTLYLPETMKVDMNYFENALGRVPFYGAMSDLSHMWQRLYTSAQAHGDEVRVKSNARQWLLDQLTGVTNYANNYFSSTTPTLIQTLAQ